MIFPKNKINIAAVVTDKTTAAQMNALKKLGIRFVEVRVDQFKTSEPKAVLAILERFRGFKKLITIRLKNEGGAWAGSETQRLTLFITLLSKADAIDVELASPIAKRLIRLAHMKKKTVIVSHHDFKKTPTIQNLEQISKKGFSLKADVVKIAGFIQKPEDLRELVDWLSNAKKPVIAIGMGANGVASRILFPMLGSALTYASTGESTAPGQLDVKTTLLYCRKFLG